MALGAAVRVLGAALAVAVGASAAVAYIHFPPMTLPKMCKDSHQIRVLRVRKYDKEKGVILFEVAESLKDRPSQVRSFKHVLRTDARGVKPILDWVGEGKTAVLFTIEGPQGGAVIALGYVFIDGYCYSVDYNRGGQYWLLLRAEPELSACYHGPVAQLREAIRAILAGRDVPVPVREPDTKVDAEQRRREINEALTRNRHG